MYVTSNMNKTDRYETMVSQVNRYLLRAGYAVDIETKVKNLEIAEALITREVNDTFGDRTKKDE